MIQKLDERPRARDISAERADGLRQCPDLNVDAAVQAEVIDRAAALFPEHAARVRVVNHHDAAELVGNIAESRQRAQIAVHAEHAIGDQELSLFAWQCLHETARRLRRRGGETP